MRANNPVERTASQPTGSLGDGGVRGGWLAVAHLLRSPALSPHARRFSCRSLGEQGFHSLRARWYNAGKGDRTVTALLQEAFAKAAALPAEEQDVLASRLLAELSKEDEFDRAVAASDDKLARLAREALAEYHAGHTEELDPDRL